MVGTNTLEPWTTWVETIWWWLVMSDHEVESLDEGWGSLASRCHGLVLIDVFYEIPHSCLEYGMGVTGWREICLSHVFGWVERGSTRFGFIFLMEIRAIFLLYWCVNIFFIMWLIRFFYACHFCCLYTSYECVLRQWWCMALICMFWFVNEWKMYLLPNRW